ncbi:transposase [Caldithrix abyssi]|nr:transposase [Caldithrix abyssi]APF18645.1 Transposase IS200 like [Caldithrix abyssi DSM 13497]
MILPLILLIFFKILLAQDKQAIIRSGKYYYGSGGPKSHSVGAIIGSFRSAVTNRINKYRQTPGAKLWQRNYWEHIIRDENELNRIRQYIKNNPLKWTDDDYFETV